MRSRKRNTNIKILQSQLQNFTINEEKDNEFPIKDKSIGSGVMSGLSNLLAKSATLQTVIQTPKDLPVVEKIKKKGIKKDELINTRRLLTQ